MITTILIFYFAMTALFIYGGRQALTEEIIADCSAKTLRDGYVTLIAFSAFWPLSIIYVFYLFITERIHKWSNPTPDPDSQQTN